MLEAADREDEELFARVTSWAAQSTSAGPQPSRTVSRLVQPQATHNPADAWSRGERPARAPVSIDEAANQVENQMAADAALFRSKFPELIASASFQAVLAGADREDERCVQALAQQLAPRRDHRGAGAAQVRGDLHARAPVGGNDAESRTRHYPAQTTTLVREPDMGHEQSR